MGRWVGEEQVGFVKGRKMEDAVGMVKIVVEAARARSEMSPIRRATSDAGIRPSSRRRLTILISVLSKLYINGVVYFRKRQSRATIHYVSRNSQVEFYLFYIAVRWKWQRNVIGYNDLVRGQLHMFLFVQMKPDVRQ